MRFKKGFTLAEILIVLMVIGALATMTIPSLMKGVTEAQFKTAYKKALNTVVNLAVMEKVSGSLPASSVGANNQPSANDMFDILANNLSVKAYYNDTTKNLATGVIVPTTSYTTTRPTATDANRHQNWIISEDNLAYLVMQGGSGGPCGSKMDILQAQVTGGTNNGTLGGRACNVVWVDVNGLSAGPNLPVNNTADAANATGSGDNTVVSTENVRQLTNDRYPIYMGNDGATAGNQVVTVTGRIAAGMK